MKKIGLMLAFVLSHAAADPVYQLPPATPIAVPEEPTAIRLYPGVAPGWENAKQSEIWEKAPNGREARNVTTPVLIPILPEVSNGTAIIVLPGGGFRGLAMDNEGFQVARMLAAKGITAFVLKYRLVETPPSREEFGRELAALIASGKRIPTPSYAVDDGRRAVRLIRADAARWGLRADRIGMIGFSAGAMTTLEVTLSADKADRPDFSGVIYGPLAARDVPADAPPAFIALAADDGLFANGDFGLVGAWQKARRPVEFHLYGHGGHGFGMSASGATSDLWPGQFIAWLRALYP